MKFMKHRVLAAALLAAGLFAGVSQAAVIIHGTRVIYPYQLAAWRLHGHLKNDKGDVWTRAANYHSRTHQYNVRYRAQLIRRAHRWHQWLEGQFLTHEVGKGGADISQQNCPSDNPFCGVTQTVLTRLENKK